MTQTIKTLFTLAIITLWLSACSQPDQNNIEQWLPQKDCQLHTDSCIAKMGQAFVKLKISPHPIPIARPLGIEVETKNLSIQKIELDITGQNMYMGYNRVTLTSTSPNRFVGTSMLAFCTNQNMRWQITLMVHLANGKQIQIPYQLNTNSHR